MTNTENNGETDSVEFNAGEGVVEDDFAADMDLSEVADFVAEHDPMAEVDKWKDVAARAQADLDNFRKRMAREKSEAIQYANRSLLEQLLPIIDNFEMGLKAASAAEGEASVILQGMSMVFKQISDFLTDQGVEVILSDGVVFDPNVHEAVKQETSDSVAEGHIIYTMRRGYRLKERILRAATVVVSAGKEGVA